MHKKFKLLITDLDGTTVPSSLGGMPSPKVEHVILNAHKKIEVSVATGRNFDLAINIFKVLKIKNPVVVNGGSQIIDPQTGKVLWEAFIPEDKSLEIIKILNSAQVAYYYNDTLITSENQVKKTDSVNIFVALNVDEKTALLLYDLLSKIEGIEVHKLVAWTSGFDIHITSNLATKRHGIEKLISLLGFDKSAVIGVGDSTNDLPLFGAVGFKVAMGNAVDELKAVADYIAPSVEEDGLAHVIEKFILHEN